MKKYIIILILVLVNCKSKIEKHKSINQIFKKRNLFEEYSFKISHGDTLIDGYRKEFYENGNLKIITNYNEGIKHGVVEGFYESGNKEFEGNFHKNKKEGSFILYYDTDKPLDEKVKIKEKWFAGKLIHNRYEYYANMRLENYSFYNLKGELYYYEYYNEQGKIIEREGSKVPVIFCSNNLNNFKLNDTLAILIFSPMSPVCESSLYVKIEGFIEESQKINIGYRDDPILYKRKINKVGDFNFQIKHLDKCSSKEYINSLKFSTKEAPLLKE